MQPEQEAQTDVMQELGWLDQPTVQDERVSLAYTELWGIPDDVIAKSGHKIKDLDLSHNKISDLSFLSDLPQIESLVLDDNQLTSQVKMPVCTELHTLWVNDNIIQNLSTFLHTIVRSCPNLRCFSMMNNQAAPSYFNGGTYEQYLDYRYYVISCLPNLKYLDHSPVTPEEVKLARESFPTSRISFLKRRRSSKRSSRRTGA